MRWRSSILTSLLLVLSITLLVAGAPEFEPESPSSVNLNPQDRGILVHEVSVGGMAEPVRIKELTLKNFGNASENELEKVKVRYRRGQGGWRTVNLEDLSGIGSGITFTLPGEGMTLHPDQEGLFQFEVTVASPERVPITKYGKDVTVELGPRFHFVYLEDSDGAVDSVSSNYVVDPGIDKIARAGFEEVSSLHLRDEILQPGTTSTIARTVFEDEDSNRDGVEVDLITVTNRFEKESPLILGQDVTEIRLELKIEEEGEVTERVISKLITSPTSEVSFSTSPDGWWDGRCLDECKVTMDVLGKIASTGPSQGMKLRTGVSLKTKENNGMAGYPFKQESVVSVDNVQRIVVQRLEEIEETTNWNSGVINQGETYKQRLVLKDSDMDADAFTVNSVRLANEGSLENTNVDEVSVYRVRQDGDLVELGSDLNLVSEWQELDPANGRIADEGRGTFEIHYELSTDADRETTFKPVVQFQGREGVASNAKSPVHESPEALTIYPWGAEIVESGRRSGRVPNVGEGSILAQRIDVMDRDENRFDLLINPIVIKNLGTATGSEFTKLELYDSDGNLLATESDLSGLSKAGVTLGNLDGKTTVENSQAGHWRTFFVFLTPKPTPGRKTVNLETTLYQTEGNKDVITVLEGPSFSVGRVTAGRAEVAAPAAPPMEPGPNFGIGLAAGLSYPNLIAFNSKFFLDYLIENDEFDESEGNPFARFGLDVDSLTDYGYFYPNASFGYRWPVAEGVHQFAGAGAGPVFINDPDYDSDFAFHGLFGITTTEWFEEDVPVLLQVKYKYLSGSVSESVLEFNLGILYR
ncbi:hypothetical protein K9M78_07330 [Candidatus Bipolaricaulota bacterium]|nr:hypothetical protein [Candidatus Bipolaricaulota bacterium]